MKFADTNLDLIKSDVIPMIGVAFAETLASAIVDKLKMTVDVLVDDNMDNASQLSGIWSHIGADPKVAGAFKEAILFAAMKIENPTVKGLVTVIAEPLMQTLIALSDDNPANGDQIKAVWIPFIQSPEFLAFVSENLDVLVHAIIKNDNTATWIEALLNMFILKPKV